MGHVPITHFINAECAAVFLIEILGNPELYYN
jgi:hypothetical protein